ncbi:MAG: CvpA family protein [Betaproteobacteria bacterium]|nr:CvpA family protein [Betaproteobacteria bacterium]
MSNLDWALLFLWAASCLLGVWRGVIRETISLLAWLLGFVLSAKYAAPLAPWLPLNDVADNWRYALAWVLIFLAVWLGLSVLSHVVQQLVSLVGLGLMDRLMGAVFGMVRGGIVLMALSVLVGLTPIKHTDAWVHSWLAQSADKGVQFFKPILPVQIERLVS